MLPWFLFTIYTSYPDNMKLDRMIKTKKNSADYVTGGFQGLLKHPRCNGSFSLRDKMYLS